MAGTRRKKKLTVGNVLGWAALLALVVGIGGYKAYKSFVAGAPLGETCAATVDCAGATSFCVNAPNGFCSVACKSASDCPSGFTCNEVTWVARNSTSTTRGTGCVPPHHR